MSEKNYKIKFTTADGREIFWHKGGQINLLPETLVDTWVTHFKPDVFEVTADGVLMGVGRSTAPTFKIVKVEKFQAD